MKSILALHFFILLCFSKASAQKHIVYQDINNFWEAYDRIVATNDTAKQHRYVEELFIDKGTPGLKAIMQVRNYSYKSYLDAIRSYPLFWTSVKSNTLKAKGFSKKINEGIAQLRKLYPEMRPATIYFTIGALRTNGTTQKDQILIGSELALADSTITTSEFPAALNHLKPFFKTNPIRSVVFGNVHEYVHTQQKTTLSNSLLGQCIIEGVAEFLAVKATGQSSPTPALAYGPSRDSNIKEEFSKQMFNPGNSYWLYNNQNNQFDMRDLGYYVGYAICSQYYDKMADKRRAIKDMIELDYNNHTELMNFVEKSAYFDRPLAGIYHQFEAERPIVTGIAELGNHSRSVSPHITIITVKFSTSMNTMARGFDFGPSGDEGALKLKRYLGFAGDGKSVSFEVELKPERNYQLLLTDRFQDVNGKPLKPYLIEFRTAAIN